MNDKIVMKRPWAIVACLGAFNLLAHVPGHSVTLAVAPDGALEQHLTFLK